VPITTGIIVVGHANAAMIHQQTVYAELLLMGLLRAFLGMWSEDLRQYFFIVSCHSPIFAKVEDYKGDLFWQRL
jgi:hypothetical protein